MKEGDHRKASRNTSQSLMNAVVLAKTGPSARDRNRNPEALSEVQSSFNAFFSRVHRATIFPLFGALPGERGTLTSVYPNEKRPSTPKENLSKGKCNQFAAWKCHRQLYTTFGIEKWILAATQAGLVLGLWSLGANCDVAWLAAKRDDFRLVR